ncbi:hypothetical protein M9Y10_021643 [Tritrichomonas musculus]|uniref:Uncharacterized protein n=1 Tax=Tritrichomonas musculus TaxID=1915356 RepID=A0ABR2KR55_9EUKA
MKSFLHFSQAYDLINKINNVVGPYKEDHVGYLYQKSGQSIELLANLQKDKSIIGKADASFNFSGFDVSFNLSTLPSVYCQVCKKLLKDSLDFKATIASKNHVYPYVVAPHIKNCITSFSTFYRTNEYNIEGFLGVKENNSISTICSISDFRASVALRAHIIDKLNILEATFLSTKYGPLASIRGDISSFSLQKVKFGGIKKMNNICCYGLLELFSRSLNFGLISEVQRNNLIIAMSGGYNHSKNKPKFAAGFEVKRKNTFCGKMNLDGTIEMMTKFSPSNLVTISLRSATSIKDKFEVIKFGWSLDFK